MKKHIVKLLTLVLFASVGLQSCSVEYREKRRHEREQHHDHDHDNDHHDNRNYYNTH